MSDSTQRQYFSLGRNGNQIIRDGSFATRKEYLESQLFNHHIAEHNIQVKGLIRKLHAAYIHEKIPDFYSYFFIGQIASCSQERIIDSINREMQLLRTKQCHYNFIMRTLNARQSCLKSLHRCLESIFEDNDANLLSKFKAEIAHYRQLTALVIEQIQQWKSYLLQINSTVYGDQHIGFFFQSNDYLLKILNDVDFIGQSFLSSKVTFSHKQDPFLLRPYTENQTSDDPYIQLFSFQAQERQRYVRCLQYVADERADYLKRKITVKEERIKQIQRAYQTKSISSKLLITKTQLQTNKRQKQPTLEIPIDFVEENKDKMVAKESKRASSLSQHKQSKFKDFLLRSEKIKKLKQMKIGEPGLINPQKFVSIPPSQSKPLQPMSRSVSLGCLKKTSSFKKPKQEKNSDFESMLREKQLQIIESDNRKRRTYSSLRLHDKLSQRRHVLGLEGAEQLQKILDQLDHASPQDEEGFIKKRSISSRQGKSLLQHNEEAMLNLRKTVLKEIQDNQAQRQRIEQQKRDERQQMQHIIKLKLDKETLLDINKEKAKWVEGKDVLAHQMGKKELFGYSDPTPHKSEKLSQLELQLKKEMQLKWLREVHQELTHRQALIQMDNQKKLQQDRREKQLQLTKRKEAQQQRFAEIQRQERQKMAEAELKKEEAKKREIELQMQQVVAREKERLQNFSKQQKVKLQLQLKQAMKASLLAKLKKQKSQYNEELKAQEARKLAEEAQRAEARRKIESEFKIEKQLQRQRQRQEKNRKVRLIAQKMQSITHKLQKQQLVKQPSLANNQEIFELKKSITTLPDPRVSPEKPLREQNKKKMRQQFELQLFSFNRQGNLMRNNFMVKDFKNKIDNEDNLTARMAEIEREMRQDQQQANKQRNIQLQSPENKNNQHNNQNPLPEKKSSLKAVQREPSCTSEKFIRFSEMNSEDKSEVKEPAITESDLRKIGIDMSPIQYMMYIKKKATIDAKKIKPIGEELMKNHSTIDQFQIMEDLNQKINKKQEQKGFVIQNISEEEDQTSKREQQIEQKEEKQALRQEKRKEKQARDSEDLSEMMKLTVHSKMSPKKKKRFVTSDESSDNQQPTKSRKKRKIKEQSSQQEQQKKFKADQQKSPKKLHNQESARFITISSQSLDSFLIHHFKQLPKLMRKLNLFKKDQLLKMILQTKSIMVIEVFKEEQSQGICFIAENENKQSIRSLNMLHFGPYNQQNSIDVAIKSRELLFSADPCAQITFSMYYEKEHEEQYKFIKDFQKRFDPYGAIFQKKINNQQTERKHVMRRMIGEQSSKALVDKMIGQLKITQHLFMHSVSQSLGLSLGLADLDNSLGGWTLLSLFLSKYGDYQQISENLASDVKDQNKSIKYLSKMTNKLKNNAVRDIDYFQFQNPFQTNLRLIEEKEELVKCDPRLQQHQIPIKWLRLSLAIEPVLPFSSTVARARQRQSEYLLRYLRFKCGKGSKVVKLKSSLYSSEMTAIPCKPPNYKLIVLEATELDALENVSLDLYIKLFLANVDQHMRSADEHIWIPQFCSHQHREIKISQQFGFSNETRSRSSLNYTQYLDNCLRFTPTHKDVLVTPPFLVGVINSDVERLTESSPVYIERIDFDSLIGKQSIQKAPAQSDF